ncbi:MAG: glycosyltransferase family 4 protein [Thermoleophilia bacterium]|nr:glycosyltransferase family 4 protein [Thermoleophilia bacterium]
MPVEVDQTSIQKATAFCSFEMKRTRLTPSSLASFASHMGSEERTDYRWGSRSHRHLADSLAKSMDGLNIETVLHAGSPATIPDESRQVHHLMCDSTWFGIARHLDPPSRFPPELQDEIESLYRSAYQQVRHFFPLSRSTASELQDRYGISSDRITPVGSGRGNIAANYDPDKDYSTKRVLFAAKQRFRQKGGMLLLEAMRQVADLDPDVRLTIVGGPEDMDAGEIPSNVTVLGFLTQQELETEFHKASLFAMPATLEPWGLVYLEALASRTPILGLRRNAFPEIAGDGEFGIILDDPDPGSIASAIVTAVNEPNKLQEMAEVGQKYALDHYTWDAAARRLSDGMSASA